MSRGKTYTFKIHSTALGKEIVIKAKTMYQALEEAKLIEKKERIKNES